MTELPLNLALIGAGRMGRLHAQHLAHQIPSARLVGIADVNDAARRECAHSVGVERAVADYRELLESPDVDAVVVCSATDTHARIIQEAAELGKHVFCEKPIDLTLQRIDAALAAVERAHIKLQLGFNRRFDATIRRVRQAIQAGEIGRPWRIHVTSRDPSPPPLDYIRRSGGLFLDMAIHDVDLARYLIGSEVIEVFATAGVLVDAAIGTAGDVDTAVTLLRFDNGVIGSLDNCRRSAYGYDQRVEVLGSRGMASTNNQYPNAAILSDAESVRRDVPLHFFVERYTQSYLDEMTAFVECVQRDTPPPVDGRDGRAAAVLALAAGRSYREGRWVRTDEIVSAG